MRAGGEAAFLALAWSRGQDPYAIYNSLDADYRPLSHKHPCPACWAIKTSSEPCHLCAWRGFVEIPLDEPGEPIPPAHPRRLRNFIYGIAVAIEERQTKLAQAGKVSGLR